MKCATCGAEVSVGGKFCENCGAPVAATAVEGAATSGAAAEPGTIMELSAQDIGATSSQTQGQTADGQPQYAQGQPTGQSYWQGNAPQQTYAQPDGAQQYQQYQPPSYQPPARQWDQPATSRALAMSLYIGGLVVLIIGLCVRDKDDAFITHHLNQALVLFIGYIVATVLSVVVIGVILGIYLFVMMIMGMVQAYNASTEELPLIGKIHILS